MQLSNFLPMVWFRSLSCDPVRPLLHCLSVTWGSLDPCALPARLYAQLMSSLSWATSSMCDHRRHTCCCETQCRPVHIPDVHYLGWCLHSVDARRCTGRVQGLDCKHIAIWVFELKGGLENHCPCPLHQSRNNKLHGLDKWRVQKSTTYTFLYI